MSALEGDWGKVGKMLDKARLNVCMMKAANRAGIWGEGQVKRGIRSGAPAGQEFAPLHPLTIAQKGSSKPLIGKGGDLLGAVTHVVDGGTVWIGVKRGVKNKGGEEIANIAAVHEFGATVPVTEKSRAYLHSIGIHLKASTQFIRIPPRPFLGPVLRDAAFQEGIRKIYLDALREAVGA